MDAVTYPDSSVAGYLNENYIPMKVQTKDPNDEAKKLMREFRALWTPTFVMLDHHGIEVRRAVGFLPPKPFLAELELGRGAAALLNSRFDEAFELFIGVADRYPDEAQAPEGLYWSGVVGYRRDGKPDALVEQWTRLKETYPDTLWWTRASFIEDGSS